MNLSKAKKWSYPVFTLISLYLKVFCFKCDKNKVVLLADFGKYGGTRTYFVALLEFLYKNSYDVTVLLKEGQLDNELNCLLIRYNFSYRIIYHFGYVVFCERIFSKFNINPLKKLIHSLNFYLNVVLQEKPRVFIVSSGNTEPYLYFFILPITLIHFTHTVPVANSARLSKIILFIFLSKRKKILTCSNCARSAIIKFWCLQNITKNVEYIYHFYESTQIDDIGNRNDLIRILTVGHIIFYKNPNFWIEVARELKSRKTLSFEFIWLGEGEELSEFREKVKDEDYIKFVGYTPDVEQYYKQTDIYFQPSLAESFGFSLVGAMAHGLPCVVSDKQALPEIIKDSVNGFVFEIPKVNEAADKIELLINSSAKRVQFGNAAYKDYLQKYTKEIWLTNMSLFLTKLKLQIR